jgi:7-cyano-7-deazaguanine synthase
MSVKAVVLLSGGIDSATAAAVAVRDGYDVCAITFAYGQRHGIEIDSAKKIAGFYHIKKHLVIDIPSDIFAESALSSVSGIPVPRGRASSGEEDIPPTYVPARNIIFLSYALGFAETAGARNIFIGVNAVDYSGYPDCRPEFIQAFEEMANIGTKAGVEGRKFRIHTPLMHMKKSEIIKLGTILGLDYSLTHSCYDPLEDGTSCGGCDSCVIRKKGFAEAGIPDPTKYGKV